MSKKISVIKESAASESSVSSNAEETPEQFEARMIKQFNAEVNREHSYEESSKEEGIKKSAKQDLTTEHNGPKGLEPTRYGDWESKGRCHDF